MGRGRPGTGVQALSANIRVRFTWAGRRCSEYLDLAPTPANIKAAERLMARLHHEIEYNLFDYARTFPNSEMARAEAEERAEAEQQALAEREAQTIYFRDFADRWLASLTVEKSTYDCYFGAIEGVWKPHFRDRPIGSIRPSEIKAVIAELVKRVTGKTVNNSLIPLRGVFAAAVDDEIIERAPTLNIKSLKHQSPKPDPFPRGRDGGDHCEPLWPLRSPDRSLVRIRVRYGHAPQRADRGAVGRRRLERRDHPGRACARARGGQVDEDIQHP
jgi:integrase